MEFKLTEPMEEKFSSWLVKAEGKLEATGRSYSQAINRLSEHYTNFTGTPTDIYSVDQKLLRKIKNDYDTTGRFSEKGYETHGLYRAAIKAFYRYKLANPGTPIEAKKRITIKPKPVQKKPKRKTFLQRILDWYVSLFIGKTNKEITPKHFSKTKKKESPEYFTGTTKQILKLLIPLVNDWEKEVHEKYLVGNPHCQRCKSMEFPEVIEKPAIPSKDILKTTLKDFPKKSKQRVIISELESKFKSQVASGDRLMVLCRTCRLKDEAGKVERYPHEMPPIMRRGPRELRY